MIDGLDNKMLFGALANLRLAPHVREGTRPLPTRPTGSTAPAAPTDTLGSGVTPSPSSAPGRMAPGATEKLSLSDQALAAYERSAAGAPLEAPAAGSTVDAPTDAVPVPSTLQRAASAYAEQGGNGPSSSVKVAHRPGALYA